MVYTCQTKKHEQLLSQGPKEEIKQEVNPTPKENYDDVDDENDDHDDEKTIDEMK